MEKISYQLTTLSSLIITPRSAMAFYKELDEFSLKSIPSASDCLSTEKLKVIYPFYQYGTYHHYDPADASYYIPGSSIKGALCCGSPVFGSNAMVDDVPVSKESIVLRNLYKAQYLNNTNPKNACFGPFFENVGVEMVPANVSLQGELRLENAAAAKNLVEAAHKSTKTKMIQMEKYLISLEEKHRCQPLCETLCTTLQWAINELSPLQNKPHVFLLGGYKGLLHSIERSDGQEEITSGVFLDPNTGLPHGLVTLEFL